MKTQIGNGMTTARKREKKQLAENIWFNAAYDMLTNHGIEAVKVMSLAKKLEQTRTSFYWYFADRNALLESIIQYWENKNTGNLVQRTQCFAQNIDEAIFNVFDCWIDQTLFDAKLDVAIRNWARHDENLQRRLEKADEKRFRAVAKMFQRFGYSKSQADVRSRTVLYTQIGYILMQVDESFEQRLARIPYYVEVFTGVMPDTNQIKRFNARHRQRVKSVS